MKPFDCNWKNPGMELFSSRRWATGSAQQSNNYGIMPCMCCIIFLGLTNSFLLGPIQPSSPTGKELHDPGQHHIQAISYRSPTCSLLTSTGSTQARGKNIALSQRHRAKSCSANFFLFWWKMFEPVSAQLVWSRQKTINLDSKLDSWNLLLCSTVRQPISKKLGQTSNENKNILIHGRARRLLCCRRTFNFRKNMLIQNVQFSQNPVNPNTSFRWQKSKTNFSIA